MNLKKNLVLVLGKSGQVAKSINKLKAKSKFDLIFLDRKEINFNEDIYQKLSKFISKENPQFIVNAAAYTGVDKAEDDIKNAMQVNGYSVGQIAKLCSELRIPLFHYSTDYVFGDNGNEYLSPNQEKNPNCVYGKSKLLGEKLINNFVSSNSLKAIIMRISWVFSNGNNNFVRTILNLAREKDEIKLINDQVGGPTSSDSVASATIKILNEYFDKKFLEQDYAFPWGEYHFQGSPVVTWYEFACEIVYEAKELGLIKKIPTITPISTKAYSSKTNRPLNSRLLMKSSRSNLNLSSPLWKKDLRSCLKNLNI